MHGFVFDRIYIIEFLGMMNLLNIEVLSWLQSIIT